MAVAPQGKLVIVGDSVSPARLRVPCEVNSTSSAFAARYLGFGPPPVAKPPGAITGSATGIGEVSATVNGWAEPGTTYDYRLVATNREGTTTGSDATFTTASARPSATTGRARADGRSPPPSPGCWARMVCLAGIPP